MRSQNLWEPAPSYTIIWNYKNKTVFLHKISEYMLILQDSINKLKDFKAKFGMKYGIEKLGIFGSVARN